MKPVRAFDHERLLYKRQSQLPFLPPSVPLAQGSRGIPIGRQPGRAIFGRQTVGLANSHGISGDRVMVSIPFYLSLPVVAHPSFPPLPIHDDIF